MEDRTNFLDRADAGRTLADLILLSAGDEDAIVLALPRGGVPVAVEIARALRIPLDVLGVKKIGSPRNPELAIGAVAEDGTSAWARDLPARLALPESERDRILAARRDEARAIAQRLRRGGRLPPLAGRTVIVADDGVATGLTAIAAARCLRTQGAGKLVFAAPVCAPESARELASEYDAVVCAAMPRFFRSVGSFYDDFAQVSDEEAAVLLEGTSRARTDVAIPCGEIELPGILRLPGAAGAWVVFAHGSGSSRLSPRNREVAAALQRAGFGTLLFDLLTEEEAGVRANVFDVDKLALRLERATKWIREEYGAGQPIAFFGASTGGAAALEAAARGSDVFAVISRGGRPDLAPRLSQVTVPALLIVGGEDHAVVELNRRAQGSLRDARLAIVPGATHLFEEPGAMEQVIRLATDFLLGALEARAAGCPIRETNPSRRARRSGPARLPE